MTHSARWVAARAMRTAVFTAIPVALLGVVLFAPAGGAQPAAPAKAFPGVPTGAQGSVSEIPTGPGALRGRVIREGESTGMPGIPVVLYAMPRDGAPGIRGVVTDESGGFAFESIPNDPATVYLLGARYAEIPFGTRFSFEPGEVARAIDLPVADPIADTRGATVGEVEIEFEEGCAELTVRESHQLDNPGGRTIYVPKAERAGAEPILRVTLPAGATGLQSELGDDLVREGDALAYWGPLRPGEQSIEFRYDIPGRGNAFELSRSFPSGAGRLVLVNRPGGPKLTRSGAGAAALRPGDSVALRVERAAAGSAADRISALEARIWLELDGAAITVEQRYTLAVEGAAPLVAESGPPLLCIALPDGADDLRFSAGTLDKGLSRDPSGAIALRGPLPTGETQLALHFLLPIERSDPVFSQVMPLDVSLLAVLIADTGVAVETSRLHQRRPIRTPDRSYLHFEGFEIPAGEAVELRLRPLEARNPLPKAAVAGLVSITAVLAIGFLIAPLGRAGTETSVPPSAASRAADQRASVLTAIHGLDEDFEIGKLSEDNYREMRQTLRDEAVELLRAERAALAEASDSAAPAERACPNCRAETAPNARFCSQCGSALARSCPRCNTEAAAEAHFCSQCGTSLDERPATEEASRV